MRKEIYIDIFITSDRNSNSSSSPRPIKSPSNFIRYNSLKICSSLRRPKTILEIRKKAIFLQATFLTFVDKTSLIYISFSKTLLATERRLTEQQFLAIHFSQTFFNTGITDEIFQQSGKQESFRYILKTSACMYESSGSQFFRTATGVQSGPDVFDISKLVMAYLTNLGVTEISCSFR